MSERLHRRLALLHDQLLSGKLPRNLNWSDTVDLVAHLGTVEPHGGGDEFAFSIGSQKEFFTRPHGHDLEVEEVSRLRRLLKAAAAETAGRAVEQSLRVVVVIDHHAAHVYQEAGGSRSGHPVSVEPYDPHHFRHHLVHRKEAHFQGDHVPEELSFYEEVAQALVAAGQIVLIGHGTGKSSAVDHLAQFLKTHHPDIARHVNAVESVDLSALTAPEIEQIAKRHLTVEP